MTRNTRLLSVLAAVAAAAAVFVAFGPRLTPFARYLVERLLTAGPVGGVAFVLVYALATVALFPGWVLSVVAGAAYGIALGSALSFVGGTIGAMLTFRLSRRLSRRSLQHELARRPRLAAFDRAFAREGFRTALLLRLSPIVPTNVLNYALGATHIRPRDAAIACVGMLPGIVLYAAGGRVAAEAAGVVSGRGRSALEWTLLGVGVAATALVTIALARLARTALRSTRRTHGRPRSSRRAPEAPVGSGKDTNKMRT